MQRMLRGICLMFFMAAGQSYVLGMNDTEKKVNSMYPIPVIIFALEEVIKGEEYRTQIANRLGIPIQTLSYWIKRYNSGGYTFRLSVEKIVRTPPIQLKCMDKIEQVLKDAAESSLSRQEISRKHGVTTASINGWINNYNKGKYHISLGVTKIEKRKHKIRNLDVIKNALEDVELGIILKSEIAKKYDVGLSTLRKWIQEYNTGKFPFKLRNSYIHRAGNTFLVNEQTYLAAVEEALFSGMSKEQVSSKYQIHTSVLEKWTLIWLEQVLHKANEK